VETRKKCHPTQSQSVAWFEATLSNQAELGPRTCFELASEYVQKAERANLARHPTFVLFRREKLWAPLKCSAFGIPSFQPAPIRDWASQAEASFTRNTR
jgi:hypothetical protein